MEFKGILPLFHFQLLILFKQIYAFNINQSVCWLHSFVSNYSINRHHENMPNFDPLKPHFYIVKLGFTGVCIIFLILLKP